MLNFGKVAFSFIQCGAGEIHSDIAFKSRQICFQGVQVSSGHHWSLFEDPT